MKRLILVNPVGRRSGFILSRISRFPPLSLAYAAAVTPDGWDIKILDENFGPADLEDADLVGITAFTSTVGRAYEIAAEYRKRGTPVVMGGIHASMLPDEVLRYADAVVTGEIEGIWGRVIEDFEHGRMKGIYKGPLVDLENYDILPRRDLLHPDYLWQSVQTSRGCPFECSFCCVSRYLGKAYRQRTAESVLRELEGISGRHIFFLDDNLIGYSPKSRDRALAIFQGMIDRGMDKRWWMQASINVADDEQVLSKAARSGCTHVFIGFETTDAAALRDMRKGINLKTGVENYREVIRRLHSHGIGVLGAFIIGNDGENAEYYRELADFIVSAGVDIVQISILTPLPGTSLMDRMEQENRLIFNEFPKDWEKFRFSYLTHTLEKTPPNAVYAGNNHIKRRIYSLPTYPVRMARSLLTIKKPFTAGIIWEMNQAMRRSWKNSHYYSPKNESRSEAGT
jgi:radical SAM superfamily enzyme YgiQ (UPF0313 family)